MSTQVPNTTASYTASSSFTPVFSAQSELDMLEFLIKKLLACSNALAKCSQFNKPTIFFLRKESVLFQKINNLARFLKTDPKNLFPLELAQKITSFSLPILQMPHKVSESEEVETLINPQIGQHAIYDIYHSGEEDPERAQIVQAALTKQTVQWFLFLNKKNTSEFSYVAQIRNGRLDVNHVQLFKEVLEGNPVLHETFQKYIPNFNFI